MNSLDLPFDVLRCIGIFSPSTPSNKWSVTVYQSCRVVVFVSLSVTTVLLGVQLFAEPELSQLARVMDFWTLFLSGTYKWSYMATFNGAFAEFKWAMIRIHAQGSVVCGPANARQFTANYLKQTRRVTTWYLFSGFIAAFLVIVNPFVTFPKSDRSDSDYFNDPKSYPIFCWIPFMIKDYWMFSVFFAFQCAMAILIGLIYLGIDCFMFGAMYAIFGQIELLKSSINTVENSVTAGEYGKKEKRRFWCKFK